MATRARIALELKDGSYISSYQHWDGYPGGLGFNLIENWDNYDKVKEAIELGDASKWGMIVGEKVDFDDRDNDVHDVQNVYFWHLVGGQPFGYEQKEIPNIFASLIDIKKYGLNLRQEQFFIRLSSNQKIETLAQIEGFEEIIQGLAKLNLSRDSVE